jgi:hypothetical protein
MHVVFCFSSIDGEREIPIKCDNNLLPFLIALAEVFSYFGKDQEGIAN